MDWSCSSVSPRARGHFAPVQGADAGQVPKCQQQHANEGGYLRVSKPSGTAHHHRPGKDEGRLQVEENEKHRHQVEAGRKPYLRAPLTLDPAFIGRRRRWLPVPSSQQVGEAEQPHHQQHDQHEVHHQRPKHRGALLLKLMVAPLRGVGASRFFLASLRPLCDPSLGAGDAVRNLSRGPWVRSGDAELGALRFVPRSLPGCYVDVGANQGQSIAAIQRWQPQARIHSFEPDPRLASLLRRRYQHRAAVTLHGYGLGDTAERATLYTPIYNGFIYDGLASFDRQCAATWLGPDTLYRFRPQRLRLRETTCATARLDDEGLDPVFIKI